MLDNKLKPGKMHFELPELPPYMLSSGIKPISLTIDSTSKPEIALLITEARASVEAFCDREITKFMLKVGLVNTSHGPICWALFYFPDPSNGSSIIYENTINPHDSKQLLVYESLAAQKYWHVIIADNTGEVINLYEFPNEYGLAETLQQVKKVCSDKKVTDFMAAKAEYEDKYSVDDLFRM